MSSNLKALLCKALALALVMGLSLALCSYNVTGVVVDTDKEPLIGASVRLLSPRDSAVIATTVANNNGRFNIRQVNNGSYILEAAYIGSATQTRRIKVAGQNLKLDTLVLAEDAYTLGDVVITGQRTPITVKEDTVEFNADAYKTQPNAVVEDLLKRLPGVEVDANGKITSNGKEITKILVDGKEFFSDDPKVASKNLPVNMVDKLQVVDRKSDLARMTGVDDGEEETVINLTVKKGMKNGWFGNVEAGYGTDDRYKGSFVVNRFWNNNQLTLLGGINNINEPGFTDGASGRFRRFGGDNGLQTSRALGLNFNVGKDENLRVGGNVMYSNTSSRTITSQDRQMLFPNDSSSYLNSYKTARDNGHNLRADFRVQWKPDSLNTFEFRPNFSYSHNRSFSNDSSLTSAGDAMRSPVTHSNNINTSRGDSWSAGARIIYNHKFRSRPGRSFSIMANISTSNTREKEDAWSLNRFYLLGDSIDLYDQYIDNHTWNTTASARVTWTEPLGDIKKGNFLTLAYNIQYRWNNADRMTYDNPMADILGPGERPAIDSLMWNVDLSNRFRNYYMNQDIRLGYKHITKATNLEVGISLVPQMSRSKDLVNDERSIPTRHTFNVAPFLRYRWKISKTRSFNINYRGRTSLPTMTQLQPVADMSDPLKIVVGNPNLDPSFTHHIQFRFQDFNQEAQRSIMAMLFTQITQNSIVSRTSFDSTTGGQTTTYANVNGVWNAFGMMMFSMPLKFNRAFQFSNHLNFRYNHGVGFNNDARNTSSTLNASISPGLAWRPANLELEIRPRYDIQTTASTFSRSTADGASNTIHSYGGMFYGTYYTPIGITLQTDLNYTATSGYAPGYNKKEWMWNASIAYSFLRGQSATVTLKAYDLLKQRSNISRTVTANYIDDISYNSLGRYFMVTFTYKFNTFGKGNEPANRNERRGPGGPPPGNGPRGGRPPF